MVDSLNLVGKNAVSGDSANVVYNALDTVGFTENIVTRSKRSRVDSYNAFV